MLTGAFLYLPLVFMPERQIASSTRSHSTKLLSPGQYKINQKGDP